MEDAEKCMELNEFEEALEFYDEAIKLYREANNESEIEKVYELIEKCYDAKIKFLTGPKKEVPKAGIEEEAIKVEEEAIKVEEEATKAEIEKKQKVKEYEERKVKETEISDQGYEIMEKAAELMKVLDFENASKLYNEALDLFKSINWQREIQEINSTLAYLKKEKKRILKELEIKKQKEKKEIELEQEKAREIDETAKHRTEFMEEEKFKRLSEIEKKKQEEEEFLKQIDELVDEAESLNLSYEQEKKKAVKEKRFIELESPYLKIIEIYREIKSMLLERQWIDQAGIYNQQINQYKEKLKQDTKLRQIEAQKRERDKAYLDSLKIKKDDEAVAEKIKEVEDKKREEEVFQKEITELVNEAEKISRDYEVEKKKAIKQGQLDIEAPYPKIIEIYQDVNKRLLERGWSDQAEIYKNQIQIYKDKLNQDKKLRELEVKKVQEQKEYEEFIKVKKEEVPLKVSTDELKVVEEEDFETKISNMVDKAIKMAREYESGIRRGLKSEDPSIYREVIEIFKEVKKMFLDKNQKEQADIYTKQIQLYEKKLNSIIP
ncbi:MAG: hypothetical protein EU529_16840 [Promethearchaeota archaeon]|nr:MAG: hypothetical protein EU529_16840 [Candidatus Lokiarchaeota archaeon]